MKKIWKTALACLARRECSQFELQRKLLAAGHGEAEVTELINHLIVADLLSNKRFAEMLCRTRIARGYGPVRIRAELVSRGIEDEIITEYLSFSREFWQSCAERARRKKFGGELPKQTRELAKQIRFLQYRGFVYGQDFDFK